jgi:hypothetical protein
MRRSVASASSWRGPPSAPRQTVAIAASSSSGVGSVQRNGLRIMETALAVSYARPWTKATVGTLEEHWLPPDRVEQELHFELIRLRDKVYAHTDDELGARGVRDVGGMVGATKVMLASEWRPRRPELLPVIEELAATQRKPFRAAADTLSAQVRRFVVEVRWSPAIALPGASLLLDELESEIFALRPTSERAADAGLVVEITLVDPEPEANDFAYGVQRLLRALRQWHRRLIPPAVAYVQVGEYRYAIPVGGAEAPTPADWTHESLIPDMRATAPEDRLWDSSSGR